MKTRVRFAVAAVVAAILTAMPLAAPALAQAEFGRITGTVMSQGGEGVPNAGVVAKSLDTGAIRKTKTSKSGTYAMPNLRPGRYEVTVEAENHDKAMLPVRVVVGSTSRLDFTVYPAAPAQP
jgi:hypothetical protein